MALAAIMSGEALMPLLASGAGICAAAVFIASSNGEPKQGEFAVGDRVEVRDGDAEDWRPGVVVSLYPIMVQVDDSDQGLPFLLIRKEGAEGDGSVAKGEGTDDQASEGALKSSGDAAVARREGQSSEAAPLAEAPKRVTDPGLVAKGKQLRSRLTPEQKEAIDKWIHMSESDKKGLILLNLLVFVMFAGLVLVGIAFLIIHFEVNPFELDTWRNWPETVQKVVRQFNSMHRHSPKVHSSEL